MTSNSNHIGTSKISIFLLMNIMLIILLLIPSVIAAEEIPIINNSEGTMNVIIEKVTPSSSLTSIAIMVVLIIILFTAIVLLLRYMLLSQKKEKALKEKVENMDDDEADYFMENQDEPLLTSNANDEIDSFLKEDERTIINILRQREGICSQATLRVIGNFSKATLSRLLTELEERNIIRKEKRGKKNLVILK